jgi:hypothetical protein
MNCRSLDPNLALVRGDRSRASRIAACLVVAGLLCGGDLRGEETPAALPATAPPPAAADGPRMPLPVADAGSVRPSSPLRTSTPIEAPNVDRIETPSAGEATPAAAAPVEVNVPGPEMPPEPKDSEVTPMAPAAATDLEELRLHQEKVRRFERLRRQIDALDERWKGESSFIARPSKPGDLEPKPIEAPEDAAAARVELPPADEEPKHAGEQGSSGDAAGPSNAKPAPAPGSEPLPFPAPSTEAAAATVDGDSVVEGPVDRLGLADSLFATDEVALALEMYSQLDAETYPPDTTLWIAFQIASCHRRLGAAGEAEKRYRQILAKHQSGWIPDLCRWWLAATQDRSRLAANSEKLSQILKTLETELENDLQRTP